jgi:hypothetical protein
MGERMEARLIRGVIGGIGFGAAVALAFALVIRAVPEDWFIDASTRVILFFVVVAAGPPSVLMTREVARRLNQPRQVVQDWATIGALTFDGVMIGFVPGLYGQTGDALAWAAAMLLTAFAALVASGQLMNRPH